MRVFVTGVKGQLGYDVMNELEKQGLEGIGVDIDEMDITDADQVNKVIKEAAPDAVIHCAAYTAVDAAEDNEEICRKVNAQGTENIAKVCEELDIKMMYISTDYVFNIVLIKFFPFTPNTQAIRTVKNFFTCSSIASSPSYFVCP